MYDDYMQNLLGENYSPYQFTYEPMSRNTYFNDQLEDYEQYNLGSNYNYNCNYNFPYNCRQPNCYSRNIAMDIESMYPEIYKIIYPMIQKACMQNNRPITEDVLDEMTSDIYNNIEADNIVNLNIDIVNNRNEKSSTQPNSSQSKETSENRNSQVNTKNITTSVQNREYRQMNNPIRDLIRILLIRELVGGRPGTRPPRPFPPEPRPFPPRPPRPPMPGPGRLENPPSWSPRPRF